MSRKQRRLPANLPLPRAVYFALAKTNVKLKAQERRWPRGEYKFIGAVVCICVRVYIEFVRRGPVIGRDAG